MGQYSKRLIEKIVRLNVGFTIVVLVLSWFDHSVPDSLIVGFFGLFGWEFYNMQKIKTSKVKKGESDDIQSNL